MPVAGVNTKVLYFSSGEALSFDDLNKMQRASWGQAWEIPGYGDLFPHVPVLSGIEYAEAFESATDLEHMAFTKGGGVRPTFAGLGSGIDAGFIGGFFDDVPPVSVAPVMRWIYVQAGDTPTLTHSAADPTDDRWDIVTVAIAEGISDLETRHFRDATTFAFSSQSTEKRLVLEATFTITAGTPAATPVMPAVPAGAKLLYAVLIPGGGSAITEIRDFTYPIGPAQQLNTPLCYLGLENGDWDAQVTTGRLVASGTSLPVIVQCGPLAADPMARLIGFRMRYKLAAGAEVKIGTVTYDGSIALDELDDISAAFAFDDSENIDTVDLRGHPISGSLGPLWGSGERRKNRVVDDPATVLAIAVTAGGSGDRIDGITWFYAKS